MAHYSTYARAVISDFGELAKIIQQYAGVKPKPAGEGGEPSKMALLRDEDVEHAFEDPQAEFLQPIVEAFATYVNSHRVHMAQHDVVRAQLEYLATNMPIMKSNLANIVGKEREIAQAEYVEVENTYKSLVAFIRTLKTGIKELEDEYTKLAKQANGLASQWQDLRTNTQTTIEAKFQEANYPLNDDELKLLQSNIPWYELVEKVKTMKIELPDNVNMEQPDFNTYFRLKSYVVMAASLQRRGKKATAKELARQ